MNHQNVRVFIKHAETTLPFIFEFGIELGEYIETIVGLLGIQDCSKEYELYFLNMPNCKITQVKGLRENDMIQLSSKSNQNPLRVENESERSKSEQVPNNVNHIGSTRLFNEPERFNEVTFNSKPKSEIGVHNSTVNLEDSYIEIGVTKEIRKRPEASVNLEDSYIEIGMTKEIRTRPEIADDDDEDILENETEKSDDDDDNDIETDISDLKSQIFTDRDELKEKMTIWADLKKMSLNYRTQERENNDGTKVSLLLCNKKDAYGCPFYLEYRTDSTKQYKLHSFWNLHNHDLDIYTSSSLFTPEILSKIDELRKLSKNNKTLTTAINKHFKTNFHYKTIYYQVKKLKELEYGKMSDDANTFIKMLEADYKKRGGKFEVDVVNNKLRSCCFMTKRMQSLANNLNDVIIIDSSHKTNRFNLPFLDVAVINNYGKTALCFIALLEDSKEKTFQWALEHLKNVMETPPQVIFSDEEEALMNGKKFKFMYLFLLAIQTVFPESTKYNCSWHVQQNLKKRFCYLNRSKDANKKELYSLIINLPYSEYKEDFYDSFDEIYESTYISTELKVYLDERYNNRYKWVKAYMKSSFCCGICTTGRIESMHKVVKRYLCSSTSLCELYTHIKEIEDQQITSMQNEILFTKKKI